MIPPALSIVMPYANQRDVNFALEVGVRVAMREMRRNPRIPPLYRSGVRYQRDKCKAPGVRGACEPFKSPLETLRARVGDCDDLGIYRCAELRMGRGASGTIDDRARAIAVRSPGVGYHVVVVRGDGRIEDPSKRLGMKGTA